MDLAQELDGRLLVIYDGHCGLCDAVVRRLLRLDRHGRLCFAPQNHPAVDALLLQHGWPTAPQSILVLEPRGPAGEQLLHQSEAVLRCLLALGGLWGALARAAAWVPRPLRDALYRVVARNRYRVWGRIALCRLPDPADHQHFLRPLP